MGGRGAILQAKTKRRFDKIKTNTDDNKVKSILLNNKKNLFNYVKQQINVDLSKVIEPAVARSRKYAGVHLEELSINDRNAVNTLLNRRNIKVENNGGYGYAIRYEK